MKWQLDFGLVRVGWKVIRQVTIRNTCDVTARYKMRLISAHTGEGWGSTMTVTPSKGMLEYGRSLSLTVKFSPTDPQRTRATLVLEVDGGITQYMTIRSEVVHAQVCLSTNVVSSLPNLPLAMSSYASRLPDLSIDATQLIAKCCIVLLRL